MRRKQHFSLLRCSCMVEDGQRKSKCLQVNKWASTSFTIQGLLPLGRRRMNMENTGCQLNPDSLIMSRPCEAGLQRQGSWADRLNEKHRSVSNLLLRAPFAERLCVLLIAPFISESLIVSDRWSEYKILRSSLQSAAQTPFSSGFQAPSLLLTDLRRPWTSFLHTLSIRLHFPCFTKQATLSKAWQEEGEWRVRLEACLHTSETLVNEFFFPTGKALGLRGCVCLKLVIQTSIFLVNFCSKFSQKTQCSSG